MASAPDEYATEATADSVSRRKVLRTAGLALGATGVAGCLGGDGGGGAGGGGATPTAEDVLSRLELGARYVEGDDPNEVDRRVVEVWNNGLDLEDVCVQDLSDSRQVPNPAAADAPCRTVRAEEQDRYRDDKFAFPYGVDGPGEYGVTVFIHDDKNQVVVDWNRMSAVVYGKVRFEEGTGTVVTELQPSPIPELETPTPGYEG